MSTLTKSINDEKAAFDPATLTTKEKDQVVDLKTSLDPENSQSILTFGVGAQKSISDFTSDILEKVKAKDSGQVGDILSELSVQVRKVDPKSLLAAEKSFLASIPGVGYFFDKLKQFKAKYSSIEQNINDITNRLDSQYEIMLRDVIMFEDLYKENLNYYRKLNLIIYAGQERLEDLGKELREKEAGDTSNELVVQEITRLRNFINQLETRIHDLELTRISTIQSFPQISMIKAADQGLAGKIQSAILNTIPLWKRHVTIAIGLYNQQVVLEDLKKVDETTEKLLVSNSELMKDNAVDTARTLQRGIISIETLEKVQKNLLDSITEVQEVVDDGRKQRRVAKEKMVELESELREKLAEVKEG